MLVSLNELMEWAEQEKCAVGAFDTPSLESVMAVIEAAEEWNLPVILQHAQIHEEHMALSVIGPIMVDMARKAKVPVCVHLDHGTSTSYLKQALELGFTSVMYDGSVLSYEDNVSATKEVVELARSYGANVEAEIGHVSGNETKVKEEDKVAGEENIADGYTDPEIAKSFVVETGIDALAASFGTVHGFYKSAPKLDFERIENIHELTGKPLVMHGGSGICEKDYREAIRRGIRKVNYFSYMSNAGARGVKKLLEEKEVSYFFEITNQAREAMKEHVYEAMRIFSMK